MNFFKIREISRDVTKTNIMKLLSRILAFNICLVILLAASIQVQAALSDDTELSLTISGGTLDVTASTTATFTGVNFSFSGQTSANNPLGDVSVSDSRGTSVGWSIDVTGEDWSSGSATMDYDGNGTATGQLSLDIPEIGEVTANPNGDDTTGFTMGSDTAFGAATSTINFATVSNTNGSGEYWFSDFKASQFIPGNQEAGTYNMTLTLTAS